MENKKMSCWDFVFSSVKTHIDDLVRQADKYTKDMNEDSFLLPCLEGGFICR